MRKQKSRSGKRAGKAAGNRAKNDPFKPDPAATRAARRRARAAVKPDVLATIVGAQKPPVEARAGGKFALRDVTADAALMLFNDGAILYVAHKDGVRTSKWVNFAWVRKAFAGPLVSPLLAPTCRMWGSTPKGDVELHVFPAARRKMFFKPTSLVEGIPGAEKVGDAVAITLPMPPFLWVQNARSFAIWALAGEDITTDTTLYRAPVPNVNDTGEICFGANVLDTRGQGRAKPAWDTFWNSPFNDHLIGGAISGSRKLFPFYRELAEQDVFPIDALKATPFRVGQLLSERGGR